MKTVSFPCHGVKRSGSHFRSNVCGFSTGWKAARRRTICRWPLAWKAPWIVRPSNGVLDEIVRRHSVLRSNFVAGEDEPAVIVRERAKCPLAFVDTLPDTSPAVGADSRKLERRLMLEEAERCFDLETDVLIRASLYRAGETSHLLFITMHHIASDGWSLSIFTRELAALYDAFSAGRESPLTDLPIQYTDYAHWQRKWLSAELLQRQLDHWRTELRGVPDVMNLPFDRPRPAVQTYRGSSHSFVIDASVTRRLQEFCQASDITLFMGLLAGFSVVLSR